MTSFSGRNVEKVLTEALDLLQKGWHQGSYSKHVLGGTRYCMMGAVEKVASRYTDGVDGTRMPAECTPEHVALVTAVTLPVMEVIKEQYPDRAWPRDNPNRVHIPFFNDHSQTSFFDVRAVMEKAIVKVGEL